MMDNLQGSIDGQPISIRPDGYVRFGRDDLLNVLFYDKVVPDPIKSRELGRPWSRAAVYVRIQHPGEKDYTDRPVTDQDKARWPRHWQAYEQGHKTIPAGTAIDVLFPQNPEIPANLHTLGVHTVEQLAGLTEHGVQTIGMGATMWRNEAIKFLDVSKGGRSFHLLQKQIDDKDNKIEVLQNQVALLRSQLDRVLAQVEQKIPSGIMARPSKTIAQETFENEPEEIYEEEVETVAARSIGDEPLFVEVGEELQPGEVGPSLPKRRGRPPGSKSKINNFNEGN